ncbi:hypothetical protein TNCV_4634441 [Trichonephila clavipes]|nr:hypothetical protein TNCV_4634441 [Trichonephila clavipes]
MGLNHGAIKYLPWKQLMQVKSVEDNVDKWWKFEVGCQLRCCSHSLTLAQNYEVIVNCTSYCFESDCYNYVALQNCTRVIGNGPHNGQMTKTTSERPPNFHTTPAGGRWSLDTAPSVPQLFSGARLEQMTYHLVDSANQRESETNGGKVDIGVIPYMATVCRSEGVRSQCGLVSFSVLNLIINNHV